MNPKHSLVGALSLVVGRVGCNAPQMDVGSKQISVEASFRERLALAPGVRLEASLLDIARADAAAVIVGKTVLEDAGQPPYRFTVAYDPAAIVDNHRFPAMTAVTAIRTPTRDKHLSSKATDAVSASTSSYRHAYFVDKHGVLVAYSRTIVRRWKSIPDHEAKKQGKPMSALLGKE